MEDLGKVGEVKPVCCVLAKMTGLEELLTEKDWVV